MSERVTAVSLSVSHILDFEDGIVFTFKTGINIGDNLKVLNVALF